MKLLKRMYAIIPDQVLSTSIIFLFGYVIVKGIIATWKEPPSPNTWLVVIVIGMVLGVIVAFGPIEKVKGR